ncbi:porin family protein [Zhouia sp. PK063]|uniref:porin family protein n=1 Tax=Zhouia sp. PK063 TaxID=3373602 RepID=UPI0037A90FF5
MRIACIAFFSFFSIILNSYAQDSLAVNLDSLHIELKNSSYHEDQLFADITYNILTNTPSGVSQNSFSYGLEFGFIKDIPFSKKGNTALGIGGGFSYNVYYSNLKAIPQDGAVQYSIIPDSVSYIRNRLSTNVLELPIEFRWRTSTATTYQFWRIYTGVKLGYVFSNRIRYVGEGLDVRYKNQDINHFQYSAYISFGYNTWNFYASYLINSLYKSGTLLDNGDEITVGHLKIGLMFYIL